MNRNECIAQNNMMNEYEIDHIPCRRTKGLKSIIDCFFVSPWNNLHNEFVYCLQFSYLFITNQSNITFSSVSCICIANLSNILYWILNILYKKALSENIMVHKSIENCQLF